jgi:hypothetical protein
MLKRILFIAFGFFMLFSLTFNSAWALGKQPEKLKKKHGGMITNYTRTIIRNLPIGNVISMKQVSNMPLTIENRYSFPIYATLETVKPEKMLEDYEAIPDPAWVKMEAEGVTIAAQSKANVDVVIHLPDDEKLLGRKFQVHFEIVSKGDRSGPIQFALRNTGILCFSVASIRDDSILKRAMAKPMNVNFTFVPERISIFNAVPGEKVRIIDEQGKNVILKNNMAKKSKFYLAAAAIEGSLVKPDANAQLDANPNDVLIKPEEVTLNPGQSKEIKIDIQIPKDKDLSKGSLLYLVSVTPSLQRDVEKFIRIYCHGKTPEIKEEPVKDGENKEIKK